MGDALESIFQDRVDEFAGVLAYHFFSAESWQKALDYSIRSGDAAFRVCAYAEARDHYGRALECLKSPRAMTQSIFARKSRLPSSLVGASLHAESAGEESCHACGGGADRPVAERPGRWSRACSYGSGVRIIYGGRLKEAAGYYRKALLLAPATRGS